MLEALDQYRADTDKVLHLALDVYERGGRRVNYDPRVDGWRQVAESIATAEIQPASVNDDPGFRVR